MQDRTTDSWRIDVIHSLTGRITGVTRESILVETHGVEWELEAAAQSIAAVTEGATARILVHFHHREDAMKLYGFVTAEERNVFRELIKVNGIGPRQALRILSGTTVERFIEILETADISALSAIPGLGAKTAQKIVLALKGRLTSVDEPSPYSEIVDALVEMGFEKKNATRAVSAIGAEIDANTVTPDEFEKLVFSQAITRLSS